MIKKILLAMLLIAPVSMMGQKFAQFDYTQVLQGMPEYKKAVTELETLGKKYDSDLKTMQNELLSKRDAYAKVADSLPENMQKRKEQELQDMYQRFQQAQQDNSEAFEKAKREKLEPIQAKIVAAVNAISKEDGFVYIVDKTAAATNFLFLNDSMNEDVTAKVMSRVGSSASAAAPSKPTTTANRPAARRK